MYAESETGSESETNWKIGSGSEKKYSGSQHWINLRHNKNWRVNNKNWRVNRFLQVNQTDSKQEYLAE
jgi:hypothetical protein